MVLVASLASKGVAGNVAALVDTYEEIPEARPKAIPRDPNQSDAGTSVDITAGLRVRFKKDTGKLPKMLNHPK